MLNMEYFERRKVINSYKWFLRKINEQEDPSKEANFYIDSEVNKQKWCLELELDISVETLN